MRADAALGQTPLFYRRKLARPSEQARSALDAETLEVVADRGYYAGEEILACEDAGIPSQPRLPRIIGVEGLNLGDRGFDRLKKLFGKVGTEFGHFHHVGNVTRVRRLGGAPVPALEGRRARRPRSISWPGRG
jgi:hypothetical protein